MMITNNKCHFYTEEEDKFICDNSIGISAKEFTKMFNDKFGLNISVGALAQHRLKKLKLKNSHVGQFNNGHIPWNKGKRVLKKNNPTTLFKKGNIPKSTLPVGTERENIDGFIKVKIKEPNVWKLKHHLIYENYYNIKICDTDRIIFLDGNKKNFSIYNLEKISITEQIYLARTGMLNDNPESNKIAINLAKLIEKTRKLERDI